MSKLKQLDVSYNKMTGMPAEIGQLVFEKKWGEQHPLAKLGRISSTNHLLYGARNKQETEQLKTLLRISYLFASKQW